MIGKIVLKGGPGSGNFNHAGRPGKVGGSASGGDGLDVLIAKTKKHIEDRGLEDDNIYVDSDQPLISKRRSAAELREDLGEPIATEFIFGKPSKRPHEVDAALIDYLEERSGPHESLNTVLQRELHNTQRQTIDIADLNVVQRYVFKRPLMDYMSGKNTSSDVLYVLKIDGVYFLHNGNHRVAAKFLMGDSALDMNVLDLDTAKVLKGGPGSGNFGHAGRPGKVGGSSSASLPNYLPPEQRVWQGKQYDQPRQLTNVQTGAIGEHMADRALEDIFGVEFSTLNVGVNNAPIDIAGDHHAIEVKAGPASNGKSAQQWRATISTEGKAEREMVRKMTAQQKREYNQYKQQQVFERKQAMLDEMSKIAGSPIKPATVCVILTPDGKRGDVFFFEGFHARIGWNQAGEDNYIGTYEIDNPEQFKEEVLKGGAGSGHWGHFGRPGIVGGSSSGGGYHRIGAVPGRDNYEDAKILAARLKASREMLQPVLRQAADELGFDGNITYGGIGFEFKVAGQQYDAAGYYEPSSGRIVIFEGGMNSSFTDVNRGLLAHEITHDKFNRYTKAVEQQRAEYIKILNEEADKPFRERRFLSSGIPKSEEDKQQFAAMIFADSHFYYEDLQTMRHGVPSISTYADSYWIRAIGTNKTADYTTAINETFAEISKKKINGRWDDVPVMWQMVYDDWMKVVP